MQTVKKANEGSILVGVIALTAIMAIAAAGLMGISRNTVSQEVDAHNDARAYLAAEAGLIIGANWFGQRTEECGDEFTMTHDNIEVQVTVDKCVSIEPESDFSCLTSIAKHKDLPYDKILEWSLKVNHQTSGYFGYFVNDVRDIILEADGIFYSPMHFNSSLILKSMTGNLGSEVRPLFHKKVTVRNFPMIDHSDTYPNGGKNRDYRYGLTIRDGVAPLANFNESFDGGFEVIPEEYTVEFQPFPPQMNSDSGVTHLLKPPTTTVDTLKSLRFGYRTGMVHQVTTGQGKGIGTTTYLCSSVSNHTHANSCFMGQAPAKDWYTYNGQNFETPKKNGSYVPLIIQTTTDAAATGTSQTNPHHDGFSITIRDGVIDGIVSVRAPGKGSNITIDLSKGDKVLVYRGILKNDDMNIVGGKITTLEIESESRRNENYGINMESNEVFAVYTDSGNIILKADKGIGAAIVSGQLFAPNGKVDVGNVQDDNIYFRVIGVCVTDKWWNSRTDKIHAFKVLYDQRGERERGLSAPGIGYAGGGGGSGGGDGTHLAKNTWRETNRPR